MHKSEAIRRAEQAESDAEQEAQARRELEKQVQALQAELKRLKRE